MTRAQLFERYLKDALDEKALAELARRREDDPDFSAQFDADLVATGKFRKTRHGIERIKGDEIAPKRPKLITAVKAEEGGTSVTPKLIMGTSAEMPKALQFLGVGEEPPPGFYGEESSLAAAERVEAPPSGGPGLGEGTPYGDAGSSAATGSDESSGEQQDESIETSEVDIGEGEESPHERDDRLEEEPEGEGRFREGKEEMGEGVEEERGFDPPVSSPPAPASPPLEPSSPPPAPSSPPPAPASPPPAPASPPPAPASPPPEPAVSSGQDQLPSAVPVRPLQAKIIPPEPGDPAYEYFQNVAESYGQQHGGDPTAGILQGQAPPQRLRSARQGTSGFFIGIVVVLLLGIGGALFFGLNRQSPEPPEGAGVIAKVEFLRGEAVLLREAGRQRRLEDGFELKDGDVITVREGFLRVAYVEEKTYLHLQSGSEVTLGLKKSGKQLRIGRGVVDLDVAPQPAGEPMVVRGANATVTVKSARATVRSLGQETMVEVAEGSTHVVRLRDGVTLQVGAGEWTSVNEQALPQVWGFLAGVNLNGGEVAVNGGTWLSYAKAQSEGFKVGIEGKEGAVLTMISTQQPLGHAPGAGLQGMLRSKVSVKNAAMSIRWPRENGRYQVFVWMMEDEGNSARSLRLNVENKKVAEELGRKQTIGTWNRFGPYSAEIKDGHLDLLLSADSKFQIKNPHLAGIAVYAVAGTETTVRQESKRGVGVLEVDSGFAGENLATEPTLPE